MGNESGVDMDWNGTLQIDITQTLKELKLEREDAQIFVYMESGDALTRLNDFDDALSDNENVEQKKEQEAKPEIALSLDDESEQSGMDMVFRRQKRALIVDKRKQMTEEQMKYSSRKLTVSGKGKSAKKMPRCGICSTYYHIQSAPVSAYDGVGIVCDICGKNKMDNPEMIMENYYYKCEGCENSDICSPCYIKERKALNKEN